jgi:hypothetical protein
MIRAYIGLPGEGKSLSLVNEGIRLVRLGRRVFTNIEFANAKEGFFDKNFKRQPFLCTTSELENLLLIEDNADFLIDEGNIFTLLRVLLMSQKGCVISLTNL